ncbi:hypothetical protein [Pelagibacterium mangrovi]|uniref:hypothetical protein n=1 Tax=Pelagibacterium mangrovi TaxID=3119828 RepID=UPI002FCB077E
MRKVNPAVFAALGSDGMTLFANAKGESSGLQPDLKPTEKPKGPSLFQRLRNRPWLKGMSTALLICAAGVGLKLTVAFAVDAGLFEPAKTYQGWPVCPRLDLAQDGCVYFTHSGNLAIERITALTGLPAEIIVGANPIWWTRSWAAADVAEL